METGKYRYLLLRQDQHYFYTRLRGISSWYGRRVCLGHSYIPLYKDTIDLPSSMMQKMGMYPQLAEKVLSNSTIIFPYEVIKESRGTATQSYKAGIEKGLFYCRDYSMEPGKLLKVTPKIGSGRDRKPAEPFYIGDGIIMDAKGNTLLGVWIRVKIIDNHFVAKKCVVKVAEKVFIDQNAPLHKIILKEILPDIMGQQYTLTLYRGDTNMWGLQEGCDRAAQQLEVVMEVDKEDVPCMTPKMPSPEVTNQNICDEIASFVRYDIEKAHRI